MSDKRIEISSEDLPDGVVIVRPVGKLDVFTFTELKKFIAEVCTAKPAVRMVVDLEQVEYIASSGWAVLLSQSRMLRRAGGKMVLANMKDEIRGVYEVMNVESLLPCAADAANVKVLLDQTEG